MRIALVSHSGNPPAALISPGERAEGDFPAAAARVTSLAHSLARLGHRVTIYALRDSGGLPSSAILCPGVNLEYVAADPPGPLPADQPAAHVPEFGSYLAQRWRRSRPDIAHAHFWTGGLAALAGARDLDVPVAQTFSSLGAAERRHGTAERCPSDARIRLEAGIARSADVLLASSTEEQADLARLGVPRAKVRMVPCGVDTRQFSPEGPAAKRSGRHRLLAAQPLTAGRGLRIAMRALAEIPDTELVITGGPDKGRLARHKAYLDLLQTARELRVDDRLVFTGHIAPGDLPALLRSADLVMSTSYDPVGLTAIQAMACGTPVIASAAGAERDAVVDMTTGLLTQSAQPAELARQARRLLANPMLLEAYGIAAADRARARYPWERIARETAAAYASCTRQRAAAAAAQDAAPA